MTNSASPKRVVNDVGTTVIHAEAGPLAALRMRAASRSPAGMRVRVPSGFVVSTTHSARKAAPAWSPASREIVVCMKGRSSAAN